MASNATWIAENTELNESLLFGIRRVGQGNWECNLPWATLSDFISTLTTANAATVPSLSRGSVYQVSKVSAGIRVKVDVNWLGTQSSGSFFTIFGDELSSLISVLTAAASETDEPIDLDGDKPWQVRQQDLPAYLQPETLTGTFAPKSVNRFTAQTIIDASDPDGPLTSMDTGQAVASFGNSPGGIVDGGLTHTAFAGQNSAAYWQTDIGTRIGHVQIKFRFNSADTTVAIVVPSASWAGGSFVDAACHFIISSGLAEYGIWEEGAGIVSLHLVTPTYALGVEHTVDIYFTDDTAFVILPDGTAYTVRDARIDTYRSTYAIAEVFEADGAVGTPADITAWSVDAEENASRLLQAAKMTNPGSNLTCTSTTGLMVNTAVGQNITLQVPAGMGFAAGMHLNVQETSVGMEWWYHGKVVTYSGEQLVIQIERQAATDAAGSYSWLIYPANI